MVAKEVRRGEPAVTAVNNSKCRLLSGTLTHTQPHLSCDLGDEHLCFVYSLFWPPCCLLARWLFGLSHGRALLYLPSPPHWAAVLSGSVFPLGAALLAG